MISDRWMVLVNQLIKRIKDSELQSILSKCQICQKREKRRKNITKRNDKTTNVKNGYKLQK